MTLKTFSIGGIHPAEKKLSAQKAIVKMPLPKQVFIPCAMHIGAPAEIIVAKGDKVKAGQLICKSSAFMSANIHSSVSGTVSAVGPIKDVNGTCKNGVTIDVEGDDFQEGIILDNSLNKNIDHLSKEEIIKKIAESGIVGMGGATFPTNVKLSIPLGKKADALIINGVECEPYLTADHRLMLEYSNELMVGISILMKAIDVEIAYIGIENNKPDAIEKLTLLSKEYKGIKVVPLALKYPQGGEKQLIDAVLSRQVPSGALPIDAGAVVQNAATAYAVYLAVQKNRPLIERVVTVTGDSMPNPGNYLVRIGTPINEVIEFAGGMPEDTEKVISGGPMMGKAITCLESPVQKGTSGILMMPKAASHRKKQENCIRCGKCVEACPMGLEPYLLSVASKKQLWDITEENGITDCIECGCCLYSCPANRPLLDYIRFGKQTTIKIIRSRKK